MGWLVWSAFPAFHEDFVSVLFASSGVADLLLGTGELHQIIIAKLSPESATLVSNDFMETFRGPFALN